MKTILTIPLLFLFCVQSFSQSADSIKINTKNYKNTIQTNLLGVVGNFTLQYERAINKNFSLSMLGNYKYYLFQKNDNIKESAWSIATQLRYYLDKNDMFNDGLYISSTFRYLYRIQDAKSDNSQAYFKYPGIGFGLGYQRFIKKRIVLNIGGSLIYNFSAKADFPYDDTGWVDSKKYSISIEPTLNLNIGYIF